jgi:hypothetical protein
MTAAVVGVVLAFAAGLFGTAVGLDRDRAFYTVIMIVIAYLYVLFAAMGGASTHAIILESLVGTAFVIAAVTGFKSSLWLVAAALAAHGIFDFARGTIIDNPGIPAWWPQFCSAYDVTAAAYLAWLLGSGRRSAKARRQPPVAT